LFYRRSETPLPNLSIGPRPSPGVTAFDRGSRAVALLCFFSFEAWCVLLTASYSRHSVLAELALTLLVAWVVADNHDATVATDDLALVANLLDAWVYLHVSYFCLGLLLTVFQTVQT
jgi:hypothetical protein